MLVRKQFGKEKGVEAGKTNEVVASKKNMVEAGKKKGVKGVVSGEGDGVDEAVTDAGASSEVEWADDWSSSEEDLVICLLKLKKVKMI